MIEPVFCQVLTVKLRISVGGVAQMLPAESLEEASNPIQVIGLRISEVERNDGHCGFSREQRHQD